MSDEDRPRCMHLNARGGPCGMPPLKDGKGGHLDHCLRHSMTDEQWREHAVRGTRAAQMAQREKQLTSGKRAPLPDAWVPKIADTVARLLDARIPDSSEPDYLARAVGALCVARLFRIGTHQRRELLELLVQIRPNVVSDPNREAMLELRAAAQELQRLYEVGLIDADELPPGVLDLAV